MRSDIPHVRIVIAVCIVAVAGYAGFSFYAVVWLRDATMTGDIIGTWKSFAVAAFAFWLGSSSGGKAGNQPSPQSAVQGARQAANAADDEAQQIAATQAEEQR